MTWYHFLLIKDPKTEKELGIQGIDFLKLGFYVAPDLGVPCYFKGESILLLTNVISKNRHMYHFLSQNQKELKEVFFEIEKEIKALKKIYMSSDVGNKYGRTFFPYELRTQHNVIKAPRKD